MLVNLLRHSILTIFLGVLMALGVAGQETEGGPSLSGVWIPQKQNRVLKSHKLSIAHGSELVEIVQEFDFQERGIMNTLKLFPDGRGERNLVTFAGADTPTEIRSTTKWKDGKLIRKYVHCYTTIIRSESMSICNESVEVYSVSADGKELTMRGSMRNGSRLSSSENKFRREQ